MTPRRQEVDEEGKSIKTKTALILRLRKLWNFPRRGVYQNEVLRDGDEHEAKTAIVVSCQMGWNAHGRTHVQEINSSLIARKKAQLKGVM
jgi:hypothetical protein